ncbi:ARM repeat-containing protein [Mycena indigotica]|uniref:MMS19 nucleotide excision repair protein n=1 Tax=Mycena indigotica TaxID=2126181 RepID=A0A8H6SY50_9AGAR|nr:ARM repeat-containing protein [Mycena indigotica]KAF7307504.1 ARM repeat-containing protein [Mycena indigotica]
MEQVVTTWMVTGRDEEVDAAVSDVSQGRLLGVVKALGQYLTSEDDTLRTKGVEFLSTVIVKCPPTALNPQSVKVLSTFFCDKLDDTETIIPALKGLGSLPAICTGEDAEKIIKAIFAHVRMRALVQSVRFSVFSIVDGLVKHHKEVLKSMKSEFVRPYISLAEGEKDPRNLLVAFTIARVILLEFDPTPHIEALSNILFCYFPITFRPPPNDPYGITADDLRVALRNSLKAHPDFGPFAIPIFLEKLGAGSPAIKRDTLQTMAQCFPVYGPFLARNNARKLWNSLKLEIFQPTDPLTEAEALATLSALIITIHEDEAQDDDIQGLARDACEECIGILREPEKSQARAAIKVLCAFMATTPSVSKYTLANVVPHLLKLFADPREVPARPSVLLLLSEVIAAARDASKKSGTPLLASYKDEVLGGCVSGLNATVTIRPALAGLTGLVSTPELISEEEIGFIVVKANENLAQTLDEDHSDDRSAIIKLFLTISARSPLPIRDQTLPLLFAALPTTAPSREDTAARSKYHVVLSVLSTLSPPAPLFAALISELHPRINSLAFPSEHDLDEELSAALLHSLLFAIRRALTTKIDESHDDIGNYVETLVPTLFGVCVRAALQGGPARDRRVVAVAGDIMNLVVQRLSVEQQQTFASKLVPGFLSGGIAAICASEHIAAGFRFIPFEKDGTPAERDLLVLFEAGIAPLNPAVRIDADINTCLQQIQVQGLAYAEDSLQETSVIRLVASIVNKHVDELAPFLDRMSTTYWSTQIIGSAEPERRRQAVRMWTWLSKALLVRSHPQAMSFVNRLFDVFTDPNIGTDAAKAFGEVASRDTILTKKNGAVVKILWAQKFATGILPRLMSGAKDNSDATLQHAYLVALTSLIKSVPHAAYSHEMSALLPLLLRALPIPDSDIRADVVETLLGAVSTSPPAHDKERAKDALTEEDSVLSQHAPSLVRTMLGCAKAGPLSTARLRLTSLRLLSALPRVVRYAVLHPLKADVLRGLDEALDDPKKNVRREAVDAREVWFKYSG